VLPGLDQIRVHSLRPESREEFARALSRDLGRQVQAVESWEECVRGADVVVEASRLIEPAPLLRTEWVKPGALVIPYRTVSAIKPSLTGIMDKVVVDDWSQAGVGPLGALRAHVDSGRLTEGNPHAELGEIVSGGKPGRESESETILLWHRGLSTTDIAVGEALLAKAVERGIGILLPYRD
jgi:alanine dehydrogenase